MDSSSNTYVPEQRDLSLAERLRRDLTSLEESTTRRLDHQNTTFQDQINELRRLIEEIPNYEWRLQLLLAELQELSETVRNNRVTTNAAIESQRVELTAAITAAVAAERVRTDAEIDRKIVAERVRTDAEIDRKIVAERVRTDAEIDRKIVAERVITNAEIDRRIIAERVITNAEIDRRIAAATGKLVTSAKLKFIITLSARSKGHLGGLTHFLVNGAIFTAGADLNADGSCKRGWNMLRIKSNEDIEHSLYDVWEKPEHVSKFIQDIRAVKPGTIVALAVSDEGSRNTTAAFFAALNGCAGIQRTGIGFRSSYAMIVRKGESKAVEKYLESGDRPVRANALYCF